MEWVSKDYNAYKDALTRAKLQTMDTRHVDIMNTIQGTDPKFAKHMFLSNQLIENFAKSLGGGVNILEQPMCNHCEKPAAWNDGGSAYCFSCHTTTKEPITVKKYLIEYTKGIKEEQLQMLLALGGDM